MSAILGALVLVALFLAATSMFFPEINSNRVATRLLNSMAAPYAMRHRGSRRVRGGVLGVGASPRSFRNLNHRSRP